MAFTFCLNYNQLNPYVKEADEIIIKYHKSPNLLDFLKEHNKQRVIISIDDGQSFIKEGGLDYFKLISQLDVTNFALRFPSLFSDNSVTKEEIEQIKDTGIQFFFNDYIDKYDVLYGFLNLGVSDVYIVNELGFELPTIHKIASRYGVMIRVFPNVAQSSWYDTKDLIKFFIRPEDIEDYQDYVEVFELKEDDPTHPEVGTVLYKAYAKDRKWAGQLKEIISNFSIDLNSRFTHPLWATRRLDCGKKCLKGGRCKICYTLSDLAETLETVGVAVSKKKKHPKMSQEELEKAIREYYGHDKEQLNKLDDILSDAALKIDNP